MSITMHHHKINLLSMSSRYMSSTQPVFIETILCWHQWKTPSWMQHVSTFQCLGYSPNVVSSTFMLTIASGSQIDYYEVQTWTLWLVLWTIQNRLSIFHPRSPMYAFMLIKYTEIIFPNEFGARMGQIPLFKTIPWVILEAFPTNHNKTTLR